MPSKYPKLNDADWLREQYLELGRTKRDIADEVGCAPSTVGDAFRAFRIRKRPSRRPGAVPADWLQSAYVRDKRSIASIAREVGVAPPTIRRALKEAGIPFRKEGRPAELDDVTWCEENRHESPKRLAKQLGCSPAMVRRAMQRHGFFPLRGADDLPYPELADADWLADRHHVDGLTHGQIAALVGCSRSAVTQAMQRLGVPSQPSGRIRHERLGDGAWLQEQVSQGRTITEIGEAVGCEWNSVRDALLRFGIAPDVPEDFRTLW